MIDEIKKVDASAPKNRQLQRLKIAIATTADLVETMTADFTAEREGVRSSKT